MDGAVQFRPGFVRELQGQRAEADESIRMLSTNCGDPVIDTPSKGCARLRARIQSLGRQG